LILAYAFLYTVLLVAVYRTEGKSQRIKRIIRSIVTLFLAFVIFFFFLFIFTYGNNRVPATGLSPILIVISSELFVVLAEAFLIFLMSKGSFSKQRSAELSLLMNGASLLLGLLVFGF